MSLADRKMNKKALFIAENVVEEKPGLSGGEVRFIEIAKGWQREGYKIHILGSPGVKYLCGKLGLEITLHPLLQVPFPGRIAYFVRLLTSFLLPKSLADFKEGVVYSTSEQISDVLPGLILKLRSRRKIRWAVAVHWLPPIKWWTRQRAGFFNSLFFLINERSGLYLAYFFADRLLPVSDSTKKQMMEVNFSMKKVSAVACGVNYDEIRKIAGQVKVKKYDAVFMKRVQAVKGALDLPDIWEKVVAKKPRAKLLVIGEGADENELRRKIIEKGLEKNIELAGVIFDDKIKFAKLAESRIFLLPSYEENWAIVIGEAQAAGIPVVCYKLKELVSVWRDSVVFVAKGDRGEMADRVIELLDEPKEIGKISRNATEYVKRYQWREIAKKELQVILAENKRK